jgi:hypothetical protein
MQNLCGQKFHFFIFSTDFVKYKGKKRRPQNDFAGFIVGRGEFAQTDFGCRLLLLVASNVGSSYCCPHPPSFPME